MFRILESQAPARQTATDTINVLSSRLQSATLLEDRRAAILGLRSFAKEFPASVASGALRPLISCLKNDAEDVDTIKIVLETLLMLFAPDEKSPEASDEIALWLADEFTQVSARIARQDNITSLLDLLDSRDFYLRLYSLQLISHIATARLERTQEAIFIAPLGISRLVALLDESREPVRNEALLLLTSLTASAPSELQKVVAFEDAFAKIFALIAAEGGLTHGSHVVSDCLALLANLLTLNHSNQAHFRETGSVKQLVSILAGATQSPATAADGSSQQDDSPMPQWMVAEKEKITWGVLAVVRIFLVRNGFGTPVNQNIFWQSGAMEQALRIAFAPGISMDVQAMALHTCADLISGNVELQERFLDIEVTITVPPPPPSQASSTATPVDGEAAHTPARPSASTSVAREERVNVIEALLRLILQPASVHVLDLRLAASACMHAFFVGHPGIRSHFLRRAIEGHSSGQDRIPNLFTVLLQPPSVRGNTDPYQIWLACVLLCHLVCDDVDAKALACQVHEGDEGKGEEVVTCVQAVTANLVTGLQKNDDVRISIGYVMLLCVWLWEDPDVVNDFLSEGSSIQALLQESKHQSQSASPVLLPGLCAALLGIAYEFSTKDSPLPRSTLHELIIGSLGREQYIDKLTRLRGDPSVRDFEVLPQNGSGGVARDHEGGLPEVYFDTLFVDFFKDNYSRLVRAIDREPGYEISVIAKGVEKGISRELVDTLRAQIDEKAAAIQKLEMEGLTLRQKVEAEQSELRKARDQATLDLQRLKAVQDNMTRQHEADMRHAIEQGRAAQEELSVRHARQLRELEDKLLQTSSQWEKDAASKQQEHAAEVTQLAGRLESLKMEHQQDVLKVTAQHEEQLARKKQESQRALEQARAEVAGLQKRLADTEAAHRSEREDQERTAAAQIAGLRKQLEDLQASARQSDSDHAEQLRKLQEACTAAETRAAAAEKARTTREKELQEQCVKQVAAAKEEAQAAAQAELRRAEHKMTALQAERDKAQEDARNAREAAEKAFKEQAEVQSELDDLLVVFGDLEEKRKADKKKLRELGQEVSEDEDEGDDDDAAD
ncbi:hypothetical protein KEM52_005070 [Ascosphaera acerosa]|nr:hypothetical protein KEM52_005070 [Ascosphaera acerosa]